MERSNILLITTDRGSGNTKHKAFGLLNLGHRQNLPETAQRRKLRG